MMTVTWREQVVSYCVLLIARMFADDPELKDNLKTLSNRITTQPTDQQTPTAVRPALRPAGEFQIVSTPDE